MWKIDPVRPCPFRTAASILLLHLIYSERMCKLCFTSTSLLFNVYVNVLLFLISYYLLLIIYSANDVMSAVSETGHKTIVLQHVVRFDAAQNEGYSRFSQQWKLQLERVLAYI